MKLFSEEHQWIDVENGVGVVGLSAYLVDELGKVTFIDLPTVGTTLSQGDNLCVVESAKAATDVSTPVGGVVTEVNDRLEVEAERINASPEQDGWICKLSDIDENDFDVLMTEEQYERFIADGLDD
ncbi:MAG: glycine cleavage system protein GcvH [Lentisphaeria bacterium]|nr:glycine cleavage system protein GcvH [Lentisphaeria bacterium]